MATARRAGLDRLAPDLGEPVAQNANSYELTDMTEYRDDPVGFAQKVLGVTLFDKQLEALEAMAQHQRVELHGCNGAGKDFVLACAALWFVYTRPEGRAIILSANRRQVIEDNFQRAIGPLWQEAGLPGELYPGALNVDGRTRILGMTSADAPDLSRLRVSELFVGLAEAQAVESEVWEAAVSRASRPGDIVFAVACPVATAGAIFTAYQSTDWHSLEISAFDHPNLRENRTVIKGGPAQMFVEAMRSMYGASSPVFKARVLGRFPDESKYSLVRREWLEAAAVQLESDEMREEAERAESILGVDVARFGLDATCVAARRGPLLISLNRWYGGDTAHTVARIEEIARAHGIEPWSEDWAGRPVPGTGSLVVDEVVIRGGVLASLQAAGWSAQRFHSVRRASVPDDFSNRRSEAYWHIRELLEHGKVAMPWDEDLWQELISTEWSVDRQGRIQVESQSDVAARLGRSPDKADAVAQAFAVGVVGRIEALGEVAAQRVLRYG